MIRFWNKRLKMGGQRRRSVAAEPRPRAPAGGSPLSQARRTTPSGLNPRNVQARARLNLQRTHRGRPSAPGDFLSTVTNSQGGWLIPVTFLVTPIAAQSYSRTLLENRSHVK